MCRLGRTVLGENEIDTNHIKASPTHIKILRSLHVFIDGNSLNGNGEAKPSGENLAPSSNHVVNKNRIPPGNNLA